MKKILSVLLILSFLFVLFAIPASAVPGAVNGNSLNVVNFQGGWYVITNLLKPGSFQFKCGWNNDKTFALTPTAYWVGIYHVTSRYSDGEVKTGHYEWAEIKTIAEGDSKMLKLDFEDVDLVTGEEYKVNFFVYGIDEDGVEINLLADIGDGDVSGIVFIAP